MSNNVSRTDGGKYKLDEEEGARGEERHETRSRGGNGGREADLPCRCQAGQSKAGKKTRAEVGESRL